MSTAAFTTLVANVGRINATRTFNDDRQLASFSVAVSRRFRSKGEQVEETDWYEIKANAPHLITMVEQHIKKGDQLIITGAQSHRTYEKTDGSNGFSVEIFAHDVRFNISKKADSQAASEADQDEPAF
jgi:single-strand DNA-binding protein